MANASSVFRVGAIVFTVFVFFSGVNGQAPAPAPNCNDALLTLSSCLSYVTDSNVTTPDSGCCPALASLYDNTPICLCELLGTSGETFGITINRTRALMLPGVCGVSGADPNLCSTIGVPVASPTPGEGPSPIPGEGPSKIYLIFVVYSLYGKEKLKLVINPGPDTATPAPGTTVAPPPANNDGEQHVRFSSLVFMAGVIATVSLAVF